MKKQMNGLGMSKRENNILFYKVLSSLCSKSCGIKQSRKTTLLERQRLKQ